MNKGMHEPNSVSVFINVFGDGYWDFEFLFFYIVEMEYWDIW